VQSNFCPYIAFLAGVGCVCVLWPAILHLILTLWLRCTSSHVNHNINHQPSAINSKSAACPIITLPHFPTDSSLKHLSSSIRDYLLTIMVELQMSSESMALPVDVDHQVNFSTSKIKG
jgi:hypothetical protein